MHWHNESWTYIETEMQGEMFGRLERRHHVRSINKKLMISLPRVPHSVPTCPHASRASSLCTLN